MRNVTREGQVYIPFSFLAVCAYNPYLRSLPFLFLYSMDDRPKLTCVYALNPNVEG